MSAPAPRVLSRRPNGAPAAPPGDALATVGRRLAADRPPRPPASRPSRDEPSQRPARTRGAAERPAEKAPPDAAKSAASAEPSRRSRPKAHSEGEKLVIRRLPPGMTEAEFVSALGPDWALNKGKVDWLSYCPGKVSIDPAKPSRPGRAYLHVMRKDDIMPLSQAVRAATWEDAKSTFTSPSLIGPPSFEFSTYKKIPGTRRRNDPRQGTIDQDHEFMAFLEALANPAPVREGIDDEEADDAAKEDSKITTTPLVEFLKEKKAHKAKEGASAKSAKSASAKGKGASKEDDPSKKKTKEPRADKADKPAKDPVKILTKKAAAPEQPAEPSRGAMTQAPAAAHAGEPPKSRRAGIAAAARILQHDLGLSPGSAHRRARHDAAKAESDVKAPAKEAVASATEGPAPLTDAAALEPPKGRSRSPPAPKAQPPGRRARGGKAAVEKTKTAENAAAAAVSSAANPPIILRKKGDDEAAAAAKGAGGKVHKKGPAVSAGATRAFVKHANSSQGVTEAALRQALDVFGTVTLVEVDKRKGFAYVDFAEPHGLVRAINASPVQVAQTAVQVLERKDRKPAPAGSGGGAAPGPAADVAGGRGQRGRGGGGGGGGSNRANGAANGPAPPAAPASTGGSG